MIAKQQWAFWDDTTYIEISAPAEVYEQKHAAGGAANVTKSFKKNKSIPSAISKNKLQVTGHLKHNMLPTLKS